MTEAGLIHARNTEKLIAEIAASTAGGHRGIPLEITEKFSQLLAVMAKMAAGKLHYKNEQEAAIALGKFVPLPKPEKD